MKKSVFGMIGLFLLAPLFVSAQSAARPNAIVKHVVLIGVDGFGARNIPWDQMPNLRKLRDNGLYTPGRNCSPTASAINWATALMGTTVDFHGYRKWNSKKPDVEAYQLTAKGKPPCIFSEIRRQDPNAYTVSIFDWDGIGFVHETNDVSTSVFFPHDAENYLDQEKKETERMIQELAKKPTLAFLYFGRVDSTGHKMGWGTPEYIQACVDTDEHIGKVVAYLNESGMMQDTAILLIADHGGHDKGHGDATLACYDIPFLIYSPKLAGYKFRQPVYLPDTAPTVAWLLGYEVFEGWRGRPALKR